MTVPATREREQLFRPGTWRDVLPTNLFFSVVFLLGLAVVLIPGYHDKGRVTALLWVLASGMSGAAVGFLFGIPKILQSDGSEKPAGATGGSTGAATDSPAARASSYRQQVNTNLTDISDWLTKIIVGLSLVNLAQLPPRLTELAASLAAGLAPEGPKEAMAFAYGLIVYFSVLGFLFGYLDTRLFLAGAFYRADTEQERENERALNATTARVATLETTQSLLKDSIYPWSPAEPSPELPGAANLVQPNDRAGPAQAMATLEAMAQDYLRISDPSYNKRVRLKDEAAARLTNFALRNGLAKADVAAQAERTGNEGLTLALAGMISLFPEEGDGALLLRVGFRVGRLHVKYRVLSAVGELARAGRITSDERTKLLELTREYAKKADDSLARLVTATQDLLDQLDD